MVNSCIYMVKKNLLSVCGSVPALSKVCHHQRHHVIQIFLFLNVWALLSVSPDWLSVDLFREHLLMSASGWTSDAASLKVTQGIEQLYWQCDAWSGALPFCYWVIWGMLKRWLCSAGCTTHCAETPAPGCGSARPRACAPGEATETVRGVLLFLQDNQFLWVINLGCVSDTS